MTRGAPPAPAVTPGKLVIIGVLSVVLVGVLYFQLSGDDSPPIVKRRSPRTESTSTPTESSPENQNRTQTTNRAKWPEIPRAEVAEFNPFAIPEALSPPAHEPEADPHSLQVAGTSQSSPSSESIQPDSNSEEPARKIDEPDARARAQARKSRKKKMQATAQALQQQGVGLVMTTSAGAVAKIGEQEVRVGDVINGVLRVVDISPRGLVVEEVESDERETPEPEPPPAQDTQGMQPVGN